MIRGLFTIAAVISLLLCAATVVLGVRSYWAWNAVMWEARGGSVSGYFYGIDSASGEIAYVEEDWAFDVWVDHLRWKSFPPPDEPLSEQIHNSASDYFGHGWSRHGFIFGTFRDVSGQGGSRIPRRAIGVPYWFLGLFFATLPCIWLRSTLRRGSRWRNWCCKSCGYDLTGNVSGICPECGTPVPKTTDAVA
jgi:hypothetical protein